MRERGARVLWRERADNAAAWSRHDAGESRTRCFCVVFLCVFVSILCTLCLECEEECHCSVTRRVHNRLGTITIHRSIQWHEQIGAVKKSIHEASRVASYYYNTVDGTFLFAIY